MPHKKEVLLYDSIYIKFKNMAKPICDVRVRQWWPGLGASWLEDGTKGSCCALHSGCWFFGGDHLVKIHQDGHFGFASVHIL